MIKQWCLVQHGSSVQTKHTRTQMCLCASSASLILSHHFPSPSQALALLSSHLQKCVGDLYQFFHLESLKKAMTETGELFSQQCLPSRLSQRDELGQNWEVSIRQMAVNTKQDVTLSPSHLEYSPSLVNTLTNILLMCCNVFCVFTSITKLPSSQNKLCFLQSFLVNRKKKNYGRTHRAMNFNLNAISLKAM